MKKDDHMKPKLLVLGRNGQLATSIRQHRDVAAFSLFASGRAECDMRDSAKLAEMISSVQPDIVVNTAAYTDVEGAESEPWQAMLLNAVAVGDLARICEKKKIPIVHFSTDYVYSGEKGLPYTEDDAPDPISIYGCSKAAGDHAVMAVGGLVLRTAWLFSGHNRNFARTMLRLAETNAVVRVVDDQYGNPTCADDLAGAALEIALRILSGEKFPPLILAAGEPCATWADLAEAVFSELARVGRSRPELIRIPAKSFETKARRPRDSRFDTALFKSLYPSRSLDWRARIEAAVAGTSEV